MKAWCAVARVLSALALRARRLNVPLPEKIRRRLRWVLARLTTNEIAEQGVESWAAPLIAGGEVASDRVGDSNAGGIAEPFTASGGDGDWQVSAPSNVVGTGEQTSNTAKRNVELRCLLVTSSLDVGGMDEVVVFLARRLPRHSVCTAVLHASTLGTRDGIPTGRLGRLLLNSGVETVELDGDAGPRWIEAWRPDVISAHGAPSWVLDTATRLSIPYVHTLHGMHSFFNIDRRVEAERGRRLAGIIAVSELVRRQYLEINPSFPPERSVTIPNGVDDWRRAPGDRGRARERLGIRGEYLFVSLSRHCLQKNTYGLVAAFEDVAKRHPEAHLVIAGRPDDTVYFNQVLRLRASLACRDRIHLRDHIANPAELLTAADGFVLDSFFEGWSLASMEALFTGVPVVLSEVGGAREQVGVGGERGYVVPNPVGDPLQVNWATMRETRYVRQVNREALIAAMSSLITDRQYWLGARQWLISDSAMRFRPDVCLQSHARVLTAAARGESLLAENVCEVGHP
jgi:glycosyltransferase involved in cell wall biosynthesis